VALALPRAVAEDPVARLRLLEGREGELRVLGARGERRDEQEREGDDGESSHSSSDFFRFFLRARRSAGLPQTVLSSSPKPPTSSVRVAARSPKRRTSAATRPVPSISDESQSLTLKRSSSVRSVKVSFVQSKSRSPTVSFSGALRAPLIAPF